MSRITTVKDKIPQKASWPGFLASGKDTRIKVVLARKLEKQGLGSTPARSQSGLTFPFGLCLVLLDLVMCWDINIICLIMFSCKQCHGQAPGVSDTPRSNWHEGAGDAVRN